MTASSPSIVRDDAAENPRAARRRLSGRQIGWLKSLLRRGLIEVWYRQAPDAQPSLQGPYVALSLAGLRLAQSFAANHKGERHGVARAA